MHNRDLFHYADFVHADFGATAVTWPGRRARLSKAAATAVANPRDPKLERKSLLVAKHIHPRRWQLIQIGFYAKGCRAGAQASIAAKPGKSCGCRAKRIGRIPIWLPCRSDCPPSARGAGWPEDCRRHVATAWWTMLTGHASHEGT